MRDTDLLRRFNKPRLQERTISELIGLCHGALADGKITQGEAEYLQKWLIRNEHFIESPVIKLLSNRIHHMLDDSLLDQDEAKELFLVLSDFIGGETDFGEVTKSTSLPLTTPTPIVEFPGKRFCFTGTFNTGIRKECELLVAERGSTAGSLVKSTDFLVIGDYATESWIQSNYGRKIEKAALWVSQGSPIQIISESHWVKAL